METIEVGKDHKLYPGDIVILYFNTPGGTWMKAAECAMVESALAARNDIEVINLDYWQEGQVIIKIEVLRSNPAFLTVGILVTAILAATAGMFLAAGWMFERAELVLKAPATTAMSITTLVIAVIVLMLVFRRKL